MNKIKKIEFQNKKINDNINQFKKEMAIVVETLLLKQKNKLKISK